MAPLTTIASDPPTVVLQEDTLRRDASGTVTGIVFCYINDEAFPEQAWNDFVVIVLGWWVAGIIRMLKGNSRAETMDLMDGPYTVFCEGSDRTVRCRFVDRRSNDKTVAVWSGSTVDLAREILAAGKTALRTCHQNNWMDPDIELLEEEVNTLRKLI